MKTFIVERYLPGWSAEQLEAVTAKLAAATAGTTLRYHGSMLVPSEESCFCHFEGETADEVRRVCDLAEIPYRRIVETKTIPPPQRRNDDQAQGNRRPG